MSERENEIPSFTSPLVEVEGLSQNGLKPFRFGLLNEKEILQARKRHTDYHLAHGNIGTDDLDPETDLYVDHFPNAEWVGLFNNPSAGSLESQRNVYAFARLLAPEEGDIHTLQLNIDALSEEGKKQLSSIPPDQVGEVASWMTASEEAPPTAAPCLIRELAKYSLEKGVNYWVLSIVPEQARTFDAFFGLESYKLGDSVAVEYVRTPLTPYLIDIKELISEQVRRRDTGARRLAKAAIDSPRAA